MNDQIYDIESYPNVFTCSFESVDTEDKWTYEISDRVNQGFELLQHLRWLHNEKYRMVGFNNFHYDYPMLHQFLLREGNVDAAFMYQLNMSIINSTGIDHIVWDNQQYITQVDLFKIHHFDNKAKSTSLKYLEFVLRLPNIEDLPFTVGTELTSDQIDTLIEYNRYDVFSTKQFYFYTLPMIKFREELSVKYKRNFLNFNDTKIGERIFINELEAAGVKCFDENKKPIQTWRKSLNLNDAVFDWIQFEQPEFRRIKEWFQAQVITETKGVFKDVSCTVNGFTFDFGLGGLHGSINNAIAESNDEYVVIDIDVEGYYPSLGSIFRFYPAHLSEQFCDTAQSIRQQRSEFAKGTPENAALKLAGNGTYGKTNSQHSCFYDPLYTMTTTINGQLLLCLLAENLLKIPGLKLIQANTDGLTLRVKREFVNSVNDMCNWWEGVTRLKLEHVEYKAMYIRDVNNYLAVSKDGKVKRKGAYAHHFDPENINIGNGDLNWNSNHGARVIAQTAEYVLTNGMLTAEELIPAHTNLYDFCLRAKVPRSSGLIATDSQGNEYKLPNITRYYITHDGYDLVKVMPPIKRKPDEWRRIGIDVGWKARPCNDITHGVTPINYDYYIQKVNDLVKPLVRI